MEVGSPVRRKHGMSPSYRWVECFKVIDPKGREIQPWMRISEAYAYCKSQGWDYTIRG